MRAVVVIDGEHYAPVVRDALGVLPYDVVGVYFAGGGEKLRGGEDYGAPVVSDFAGADVVVDLSDEPVMSPAARFALASRALAEGLSYVGADFRFDPPAFEPFPLPSIAVIGTGKRVGKTAVTGHVARHLSADARVVVVAMGRGGPAAPEVVARAPSVSELLELSRSGRHAASDHLETAVAAGVPTIGCRRAGGGLAGAVTFSNVAEGARLAIDEGAEVVVFDGSGAAIPPIAVDRRILVVGRGHDPTEHLNAYRLLVSDLVVLVGGAEPVLLRELEQRGVECVEADLQLRPLAPIEDRRVAVFTTGDAPTGHLAADVVAVSRNLADRAKLTDDLRGVEADAYVVELKAAAIDVVAEAAEARGVELVLAVNDVVSPELDARLGDFVPIGARS